MRFWVLHTLFNISGPLFSTCQRASCLGAVYVNVDPGTRQIAVSRRIREDFDNGPAITSLRGCDCASPGSHGPDPQTRILSSMRSTSFADHAGLAWEYLSELEIGRK